MSPFEAAMKAVSDAHDEYLRVSGGLALLREAESLAYLKEREAMAAWQAAIERLSEARDVQLGWAMEQRELGGER